MSASRERIRVHAPPGTLVMFTVYENPSDFPGKFVARASMVLDGETRVGPAWARDTLEEVRAILPPGLYCMPRLCDDEPVIVEVWL